MGCGLSRLCELREPWTAMAFVCLDLDAFAAAPLIEDPFAYVILPGFVRTEARSGINADYPAIAQRGSFPVTQLSFGPRFQQLVDELNSDEFRSACAVKFSVDLSGRPSTITVRGRCDRRDGKIHTNSISKIITVLIYMNPSWEDAGGRLRLLRSGHDLEDVLAEIPPSEGLCWRFGALAILGMVTARSPASAGSFSSIGLRRKATGASPCSAIICRRLSSAFSPA